MKLIKKAPRINFKLCRSFSLGLTVHSPTLNGVSFEICLGCFCISFWGRGDGWIGFNNYWNG